MVRVKGLEPSHLSIPEPKSGASTNSATPAQVCHGIKPLERALCLFQKLWASGFRQLLLIFFVRQLSQDYQAMRI